MSSNISLSANRQWWVGTPYMERLCLNVRARYGYDIEAAYTLFCAPMIGGLSIESWEPEYGTRLIYTVAKDTLGDAELDQGDYRQAIKNLVDLFEADGRYTERLESKAQVIKLRGERMTSQDELNAIEATVGCPISELLKMFVYMHDGAEPEPNMFSVGNISSSVNQFIPADAIPRERALIENVPPHAYPIAWLHGGDYALMDEGCQGAVRFWDHETHEIWELAPSLPDFLIGLKPFDINSFRPRAGRVESVWADTEFLNKVRETW